MYLCKQMLGLGSATQVPVQATCTGMLKPFQHEKQEENLCLLIEDQTSEWWFEEAFLQKFEGGTSRGKTDKSRVVLVEVGIGESWRLSLCLHPHCPTVSSPWRSSVELQGFHSTWFEKPLHQSVYRSWVLGTCALISLLERVLGWEGAPPLLASR